MTWESQESSSTILTRTICAALQGKRITNYEFDPIQRGLLKIIGCFPQKLALRLVPAVQKAIGLNPGLIRHLRIEDLIAERISDYRELSGKKSSIVLGLPIGGAAGHLAVALDAPFLPHSFVLTIKGGAIDGSVQRYFEAGYDLARTISRNNQRVTTIQHFDPVHDGWLTRHVNHIRLRLRYLPQQYKTFIKEHVQDGGDVFVLMGKAEWPQFQVGPDNLFQIGGWGDLPAEEFLKGSPRLQDYCEKNGLKHSHWFLEGYPLIDGYESEWGSQPEFLEDTREWCRKEGYHCRIVSFDHPQHFSRLAFHACRSLFKKNGINPRGVLVEIFSQYDLTAVLEGGLLPLWLIFNTADSLAFLKSMLPEFPQGLPVYLSSLSTFSITPDLVPYSSWEAALCDFKVVNIGARESHYPADTLALCNWQKKLYEEMKTSEKILNSPLIWEDISELLK